MLVTVHWIVFFVTLLFHDSFSKRNKKGTAPPTAVQELKFEFESFKLTLLQFYLKMKAEFMLVIYSYSLGQAPISWDSLEPLLYAQGN